MQVRPCPAVRLQLLLLEQKIFLPLTANKKPKDALQLYLCLTSPLYMLITVHVNSWPDVGLHSKGFSVAAAANIRILFKKWLYGDLKVSHLNTWIGNFLTLAETQLTLSHQIPWQSITLTSGGWREDNLVQGQTQFWPWMEGRNDHIWCCRNDVEQGYTRRRRAMRSTEKIRTCVPDKSIHWL